MVKPNATALRRFKGQIEEIAMKKSREVKNLYPDKVFHPVICVKNGGGKIRSAAEIRSKLPEQPSSWDKSIYVEIVFDLEKERIQFEETQKEIVAKREALIDEINKESNNIVNAAYFGETNLAELLSNFEEKKFT